MYNGSQYLPERIEKYISKEDYMRPAQYISKIE